MKLLIQGLCVSALISVSSAESNIYETQNAIMQEIPARLREHTLEDKQIINGCTVIMGIITRKEAKDMHLYRFVDLMSAGKPYILIRISAGEKKEISLGGGDLILLYDSDTYECVGFCRTR